MTKDPKTFPILMTEKLILRQLSKSDSGAILQLRSDTEVNKYLDRKTSKTLEDALGFINSIIENTGNDGLFYWAITQKGDGKLIGTICLFDFLDAEKKCEIGYELLPQYHGQGIMAEAIKKVIEYAVQALGIKAIDATPHNENQSSIKLLQKTGFKQLDDINAGNAILNLFRLTN